MKRPQGDGAAVRRIARRRNYDAAFKRHLVELSLVPGASVSQIALEHRMNANVLFKWRRHHLRTLAQSTAKPAPAMLPVRLIEPLGVAEPLPPDRLRASSLGKPRSSALAGGVIEIDMPPGRIRLSGVIDLQALRVVLEVMSQR